MKLGIIGSGNVAFHLANYLYNQSHRIQWIYGRNSSTVIELSTNVNATPLFHLTDTPVVDLIIVCVSDNSIQSVVEQLPHSSNIIITSGTFDIANLEKNKSNIGVFYPLQTFTKNSKLIINQIPFIIESKSKIITSALEKIIESGNLHAISMNYEQRKNIHLSAVFLNNFINHLIYLIQEKSTKESVDFKLFHPLISETIRKTLDEQAKFNQTGPAKRKDTDTIAAHQKMLEGNLLNIYTLFTKSILETYYET